MSTNRGGQLMPRDHEVLDFLVRVGAATAEQVHRELFADQKPRNAYRRLEVLAQHKYVNHERIYWRKPGVWWATQAGTGAVDTDLSPYRLRRNLLEHTLELVNLQQEVRESGEPYLRWITEREIRHQSNSAPLADGLMKVPPRKWIAVELELTAKRSRRYRELLEAYAKKKGLAGVRFYFTSASTVRWVREMAREIEGEHGVEGYFDFWLYEPEGYFRDAPRRKDPGDGRIRKAKEEGDSGRSTGRSGREGIPF